MEQGKNPNKELLLKIREDNSVSVEILSGLFKRSNGFLRPFGIDQGLKAALKEIGTLDGWHLLKYLFSLPSVEAVYTTFSSEFVVKIYPTFDLENDKVKEIVIKEILGCVNMAVGEGGFKIVESFSAAVCK